MDKQTHINKHKELHAYLDELLADFIGSQQPSKYILSLPIHELLKWSYKQTIEPDEHGIGD